jgi:hypothetical protein
LALGSRHCLEYLLVSVLGAQCLELTLLWILGSSLLLSAFLRCWELVNYLEPDYGNVHNIMLLSAEEASDNILCPLILPHHDLVKQSSISEALYSSFHRQQSAVHSLQRKARTSGLYLSVRSVSLLYWINHGNKEAMLYFQSRSFYMH